MDKMRKSSTEDRISRFPHSVLVKILSFLDMEEVVRTSVLSKRWQFIWTSVPTLTFVCPRGSDVGVSKFVKRVNIALLHFQQTSIEKFKIDTTNCYTSNRFSIVFYDWAHFAANKKVRDLCFRFNDVHSYDLVESVCCNSSLTNLSLCGCYIPPVAAVSWSSLKSLTLENMDLHCDTFGKVLLGCPVLEYLKIMDCCGFNSLGKNESKTLRELVIGLEDSKGILFSGFNISAPNLRVLHFYDIYFDQFQGVNVPSLVSAELNFSHPVVSDVDNFEMHYDNFRGFLGNISHVKELDLGDWFIQCLSSVMFVLEPFFPLVNVWAQQAQRTFAFQFSSLTSLKVRLSCGKLDVPGLITLLKCSPNLETLIVDSSDSETPTFNFLERAEEYWSHENSPWWEKFPLPHLKTVEFIGFWNLEDVDKYIHKLVQFLLKNAGHLGRIIISGKDYELILKTPQASKTHINPLNN